MVDLVSIYKLLSDETRLRVLTLLYLDQLCVCQLTGITKAPQPRISKILSRLRDLNLVEDQRKDQYVYYKLRPLDQLLITNLEHIIEHKDLYPTIKSDIEKIATKKIFIES